MAEPDAFDPTHALDGWRAPAPEPPDLRLTPLPHVDGAEPAKASVSLAGVAVPVPEDFDPTHMLDGWRAPAPVPVDLQLRPLTHADGSGLDGAKLARLKARGYEMVDVEDIEVADQAPPRPAIAAPVPDVPLPAEPLSPPVFAQAAVLEVEPLQPPVEPDAEPRVEPVRLFEEAPAGVEAPAPDAPAAEPALIDRHSAPVVEEIVLPEATEEPQDQQPAVQAIEPPQVPPSAPVDASALEEDAVPPAEEIEVPKAVETPRPVAAEAPVLDFHAPAPAEADSVWLLGSIRLPEVAPPAAFEAPVLDFHLPPRPPEPDPRQVLDAIVLPVLPPQPTALEAPVLDIAALAPHVEPDPRLLAHWQPQAWMALARQVANASTEVLQAPDGPHVENYAPQWLCAVWPPLPQGVPMLRSWPELAALVGAETREEALQAVLGELPAEASLWAAGLEADWSLVAELVLQQDAGLRPAQARALREVAEAERSASRERLRDGYQLDGRVARRRP